MKRTPRRVPEVPPGVLAPVLTKDQVLGCPVQSTLGLLGRKWALLVLRDLTFYPGITFGHILRRNPGMTQRLLSLRLRELRDAGLVEKLVDPSDDRVFHYRLTAKGMDAVPVMTALSAYGMKHLANEVFQDGRPRELAEVFPGQSRPLLGELRKFALSGE
jgi:DNA-binding HxlR family transcriptional regulator